MKYIHNIFFYAAITAIAILLYACSEDYSPRPRGYFRIDLPEKEYRSFDTTFPYRFEYPAYAEIKPHPSAGEEPYWINIFFPFAKAQVHLSYKEIEDNLPEYLEDTRTFVMKHIPKANYINDSMILRREDQVFGLLYRIEGPEAASPSQFFVTDSASHFVRGALYFNFTPNNDSLEPVIDFLDRDILHLLKTFHWKDKP
jgi:gliding motility-associated lipoprotein GldD